jgi:hypothetical protein
MDRYRGGNFLAEGGDERWEKACRAACLASAFLKMCAASRKIFAARSTGYTQFLAIGRGQIALDTPTLPIRC